MRARHGYYLVVGLSALSLRVSGPYGVLWMQRGLGIGALFTRQVAYAAAQGLLEYPTGALADKLGRRKVYACGYAPIGASFVILGSNLTRFTLVVSSVLVGAGLALASGALEAWVADQVRSEEKLVGTSHVPLEKVLSRGDAVHFGCMAAAGLVGSVLNWLAGLRAPILAGGYLGITTAIVTIAVLTEDYGALERSSYSKVLKDGLGTVLGSRALIATGTAMLLFQTDYQMYGMLDAPLLSNRGVPDPYLGLLYAAADAFTAVGSACASRMMPRWKPSAVALSARLAWGSGLMVLLATRNAGSAIMLYLVLDCLFGLRSPAVKAWRNALIPAEARATALSVLAAVAFLGPTLFLMGVTPLSGRLGLDGIMILASSLALTSSLALAVAGAERRGVGKSGCL